MTTFRNAFRKQMQKVAKPLTPDMFKLEPGQDEFDDESTVGKTLAYNTLNNAKMMQDAATKALQQRTYGDFQNAIQTGFPNVNVPGAGNALKRALVGGGVLGIPGLIASKMTGSKIPVVAAAALGSGLGLGAYLRDKDRASDENDKNKAVREVLLQQAIAKGLGKSAAGPQVSGQLQSINNNITPEYGRNMAQQALSGIDRNLYQPSQVFGPEPAYSLPQPSPSQQYNAPMGGQYTNIGDPYHYNPAGNPTNITPAAAAGNFNLVPPKVQKQIDRLSNFQNDLTAPKPPAAPSATANSKPADFGASFGGFNSRTMRMEPMK